MSTILYVRVLIVLVLLGPLESMRIGHTKPVEGSAERNITKYSCGKVPLKSVWFYASVQLPPWKLNCGDDNSEVAGGGVPDEVHFALCVLTTKEKLSAYTPPFITRQLESVYAWAKVHTDCEVDTTGLFYRLAKPSKENALMQLHRACFEYESAGGKVVPPLKELLPGQAKSVELIEMIFGKDCGSKSFEKDLQAKYVEMIFGMVLGYSKRATFDYLTTLGEMRASAFETLYTSAREEVSAFLRQAELSEDMFAAFLERSADPQRVPMVQPIAKSHSSM
eukprot:CAMPEP_0169099088 /NCGR_PEP_ID=MMETSP1015-20121227/20379_1 /TAXON_ID=342587 /ORGANISM="Karlodinium micrum, Strain CCMP2283" /LENGTH=278 /DNA_ID=CAMNT_0009159963 /DNA_START=73 /DNA_END=909 /DNA_ORIENTATION=-